MGNSGGLQTNVEEKIANYNAFFAEQNADVLMMQEFTEYVDANQQYQANSSIFNRHFAYSSYSEKETVIKSQYPFANSAFSYLHTSGDFPAWCIYGNTTIGGLPFTVVSAVLNSSSVIEEKLRALNKLVNVILPNSENVIIGMDTNALSQAEADSMKNYMESNGFLCANWDRFGYLETYNLNWSGYRCIDNIFTRGSIGIDSFFVPDVYADLSSDHYPVVANLSVYL